MLAKHQRKDPAPMILQQIGGEEDEEIGQFRKTKAREIELVHRCKTKEEGTKEINVTDKQKKVFQRKRWRINVESWKKGEEISTWK